MDNNSIVRILKSIVKEFEFNESLNIHSLAIVNEEILKNIDSTSEADERDIIQNIIFLSTSRKNEIFEHMLIQFLEDDSVSSKSKSRLIASLRSIRNIKYTNHNK